MSNLLDNWALDDLHAYMKGLEQYVKKARQFNNAVARVSLGAAELYSSKDLLHLSCGSCLFIASWYEHVNSYVLHGTVWEASRRDGKVIPWPSRDGGGPTAVRIEHNTLLRDYLEQYIEARKAAEWAAMVAALPPEPVPQVVSPKVYKDPATIKQGTLLWHVHSALKSGGGQSLFSLALWYNKKASPTAISARIRQLRNDYGLTINRIPVKGSRQPLYRLEV